MNTILLQFWEKSEETQGIELDGCSLHIDKYSYKQYINSVYKNRSIESIPIEYDRIVGECIEISVNNDIYDILLLERNVRLPQYQLNNLIKLKNIIIDHEYTE